MLCIYDNFRATEIAGEEVNQTATTEVVMVCMHVNKSLSMGIILNQ